VIAGDDLGALAGVDEAIGRLTWKRHLRFEPQAAFEN
jgi:hypothetical protein